MKRGKKAIKIIVVFLITVFLMACCYIGAILYIYRPAPVKLLPVTLFVSCDLSREAYVTLKYYFCPYPVSNNWIYCGDISEIWKYLDNEKVQKIAFCVADSDLSPDNWWTWGEIADPNRICQTLKLIRDAKIKGYIGVLCFGRMKIITDKHKFIVPVEWDNELVFCYRWKSTELRDKLRQWGFSESKNTNVPAIK